MTRTSSSRLLLALALALACGPVAAARVAEAQPLSASDIARARDLFNQGMDARDAGRLPEALAKLEAAHALAETPLTGLELGRTHMMMGKLIEARETFASVARIAVLPEETARSTAARAEAARLAAQLQARIPSLSVTVAGVAADSVTLTLDGASVPLAAFATAHPVDPGSHHLVATSTAGWRTETTLTLREGESREVDLALAAPSVPPAVPPATPPVTPPPAPPAVPPAAAAETPPPSPRHTSPLVYAGFAVAGAGLVTGGITGVIALSKGASVKNACDGTTRPRSVDDDLQSGRTMATVSTIGFVVAGVGAAAGIIGLLVSSHGAREPAAQACVTPWIGPGSAGVGGSF